MKRKYTLSLILSLVICSHPISGLAQPKPAPLPSQFNEWIYLSTLQGFTRGLLNNQIECQMTFNCNSLSPIYKGFTNIQMNDYSRRFIRGLNQETLYPVQFDKKTNQRLLTASKKLRQGIIKLKSQRFGQGDSKLRNEIITKVKAEQKIALNRMLNSSLKANMHTLQTIVETYAVDWGGVYPNTITELKNEATGKYAYWKSFKNPYTENKGIGINGSLINYTDYKKGDIAQKGLVVYSPIYNNSAYKKFSSAYKIYGIDDSGHLLKSREMEIYLTNS